MVLWNISVRIFILSDIIDLGRKQRLINSFLINYKINNKLINGNSYDLRLTLKRKKVLCLLLKLNTQTLTVVLLAI